MVLQADRITQETLSRKIHRATAGRRCGFDGGIDGDGVEIEAVALGAVCGDVKDARGLLGIAGRGDEQGEGEPEM